MDSADFATVGSGYTITGLRVEKSYTFSGMNEHAFENEYYSGFEVTFQAMVNGTLVDELRVMVLG